MSSVPGKGARIAGHDYCAFNDDDIDDNLCDLDLGTFGLTVQNSPGGSRDDQEKAIKNG